MKITIDDRELEVTAETLGEALVAVLEASDGRMVIRAEADGNPVPMEDLVEPPETSPYASAIVFHTVDPTHLIHETLFSAVDIIREIKPKQKDVADLLLAGDIEAAKEQLMAILAGWLDVNKTVQVCTSSGHINKEAVAGLDPSLDEMVVKLASDLGELRGALTSSDFTAVSDLLGYEMMDQADAWTGLLTSLADSVR